jgi:AraC-like DNA-binding protein
MTDLDAVAPATSYIGSVLGVEQAMEAYGLDGVAVLAEVGIDLDTTPSFDARIPVSLVHQAIRLHAGDELDPLFGLKFAEFVNPTTYHAFGVMLTSSTTLRAFCQRLQRYFAYVNTGDRLSFDEAGELAYQQLLPSDVADRAGEVLLHESAWAATWLRLIRMVYKPDYVPEKVRLAFPAPIGYTDGFDEFFACAIEYDAEHTALCIAEEDLDFPLPGGNAELARHSECLVYNYLKTFTEISIANAARMSLFTLLPRGDFSLSSLSESLEMSEQELSVELKSSGTSYQQLLGDTRRELAEEYILRSELSVNEIAYMLGFSDCSNFARSFRRWTGKSPTDFREELYKE